MEYSSPGQPTKYKPEYCEQLVQHMASGMSYLTFAAVIGLKSEQTLYNWEEMFPEFLEAKKEAMLRNRLFWEGVAVQSTANKLDYNPTMVIFNLKNRFPAEWRDRKEVDNNIGINKESPAMLELVKELIALKKNDR